MQTHTIAEVNKQWNNFKRTFVKKAFPTKEAKDFFEHSTITEVKDITHECDGIWAFVLELEHPKNKQIFSFIIVYDGYVCNFKGNEVLSSINASDDELSDIFHRIFDGFVPFLQQGIYLSNFIAN